MTRKQATRLRRKGETTVRVRLHDPSCPALGDRIEGLPEQACNCNSKRHGFYNIWKGR